MSFSLMYHSQQNPPSSKNVCFSPPQSQILADAPVRCSIDNEVFTDSNQDECALQIYFFVYSRILCTDENERADFCYILHL